MNVKFRSFLSFGIIFLLILFLGIFQQLQSTSQIDHVREIKDKTLQSALLSDELKLSVVQVQQYLSDISASRAKDGLDDGFYKAEKYKKLFYKDIERLKQLNPDKLTQLNALRLSFDSYYSIGKDMAEQYIQGGPAKGNQRMLQFDKAAVDINSKVNQFQKENVSGIHQSLQDIEDLIYSNIITFTSTLAIVFVVGIIISILLSRSIIVPLRKLMKSIETITRGDLRHSVVLHSKDEFGKVSQGFDQMRLNLSKLIQQIHCTSMQIVSSSEELTASVEETEKATQQIDTAMQKVAIGTEQQASTLVHSSHSVCKISQSMNQANAAIQSVNELGIHAKDYAEQGNQVVQKTLVQMNVIQNKVDSTSDVINRLGETSKEIGQIVSLITDIAKQTNLLALNAAIESSRAGEQGKGFSIVAAEVKKLAEQSGQSASEIRELVEQIQIESDHAIQSMNDGASAVQDGINMTSRTGDAFKGISKIIQDISAQTNEVSAVVEQVNASTDGMVDIMNSMTHHSEDTAASTQHVAAAVEEQHASMQEMCTSTEALSHMVINLEETVNQFKLS